MPADDPLADGGEDRPHTNSKVGRLIEEYDLTGMGAELEARWTGDGDERSSLRDLADEFNRELLRTAIHEAGGDPLAGEVENFYRLLTGDVKPIERTRARRALEGEGVDVDALTASFVSHQAIHTYLTKYRGVERDTADTGDKVERDAETIERAKSRLTAVVERTITNLANTGRVAIGPFSVITSVQVVCEGCGNAYAVSEFLSARSCDCEEGG